MKNLKRIFVFALFAFAAVLAFGAINVKAAEIDAYSTGFESSEGFVASTTYNNTEEKAFGPVGKQWKVYYGTASTTSGAYISGQQGL